MASAPLQTRMSVELFRQFVADRSDKERWELIDGVAMMMAPPTLAHQCIASNLQLLLNQALESHSPTLVALQTIGVNIAPTVEDYDPEPDGAALQSHGHPSRNAACPAPARTKLITHDNPPVTPPPKPAGCGAGSQSRTTTSRSVPDSPPQASPGRPSIWRTFAPLRSLGNVA
jgi:Putative restriction endonuclease